MTPHAVHTAAGNGNESSRPDCVRSAGRHGCSLTARGFIAVKRFKSPFWRVEFAYRRACLEFQDAPVLPTAFNLTFDGKTLRRCHLKLRIANEVGVSFQRSRRT